jgi:hypothetical protein
MITTTPQNPIQAIKTRLRPKRPTTRGKTANWKTPSMHPYTDRHNPIDAGLNPSPPNSIEVDQIRGINAKQAVSKSAIIE